LSSSATRPRNAIADQRDRGQRQRRAEFCQKMRHAGAADLLVEGEGVVDRHRERLAQDLRQKGERHGDEAFHVCGAATIEPCSAPRQAEGVARPGLPFDRHHVGMARENDAAGSIWSHRCIEVGFLAARMMGEADTNAALLEQLGRKPDQGQVRLGRDRVVAHQPIQKVQHGRTGCAHEALSLSDARTVA
jgi:hypothetical protein